MIRTRTAGSCWTSDDNRVTCFCFSKRRESLFIDIVACLALMSWQLANFCFFGRRVQTAPTVVQPLRHLRCCDGDAVTFECHFSGQPEGVRWQRGGKVISNFPAVFFLKKAKFDFQNSIEKAAEVVQRLFDGGQERRGRGTALHPARLPRRRRRVHLRGLQPTGQRLHIGLPHRRW